MVKQKRYNLAKKRKREGKTNYKKRLKLLLSSKLRLVIRPSLNNMSAQIIEYSPEGDHVIVSAHSSQLEKLGWKFNKGNLPAAYLTGLLLGTKAKNKEIKEAILDIGLNVSIKGSRIFACLKGVIDAGLKVPCSKDIFPSEERIKGKHIIDYAAVSKKDSEITQISKIFDDVKNKIIKVE